jgi:hypothetical protein
MRSDAREAAVTAKIAETMRFWRKGRRLAATITFLALLSLGICPAAAAASQAGHVTNYPLSGYINPYGITAGPDGNM